MVLVNKQSKYSYYVHQIDNISKILPLSIVKRALLPDAFTYYLVTSYQKIFPHLWSFPANSSVTHSNFGLATHLYHTNNVR